MEKEYVRIGYSSIKMFELPLFPLNLVLFPGMPLQLHVFEERYKKLVQVCLQSNRSFGVALIRSGSEALGPLPEPFSIGCMARIVDLQRLDDGRMNLMLVGKERFRILSLDRDSAPYLVGKAEFYPMVSGNLKRLRKETAHLRPRIERYVQQLIRLSDLHKDPDPLPDDPEMIAYLAAILLQVPLNEKQTFLEAESTEDLIHLLDSVLVRELALMRAMLAESSRDGIGVFSRN